jgi:hypothetical protein
MGPLVPINIAFPLRVERYTSVTTSLSFPDIYSGFYLDMYRKFTVSYKADCAYNAEGFAKYTWSTLQTNPSYALPLGFPGANVDARAFVSDIEKLITEAYATSNAINSIVFTTFNTNDYSKICDGSGFPFVNQKIVRPTQPTDVPRTLRQVLDEFARKGRSYALVYVDALYIIFTPGDLIAPTASDVTQQYIAKTIQVIP